MVAFNIVNRGGRLNNDPKPCGWRGKLSSHGMDWAAGCSKVLQVDVHRICRRRLCQGPCERREALKQKRRAARVRCTLRVQRARGSGIHHAARMVWNAGSAQLSVLISFCAFPQQSSNHHISACAPHRFCFRPKLEPRCGVELGRPGRSFDDGTCGDMRMMHTMVLRVAGVARLVVHLVVALTQRARPWLIVLWLWWPAWLAVRAVAAIIAPCCSRQSNCTCNCPWLCGCLAWLCVHGQVGLVWCVAVGAAVGAQEWRHIQRHPRELR